METQPQSGNSGPDWFRFKPTYKGWKLSTPHGRGNNFARVLSLPTRDGNANAYVQALQQVERF